MIRCSLFVDRCSRRQLDTGDSIVAEIMEQFLNRRFRLEPQAMRYGRRYRFESRGDGIVGIASLLPWNRFCRPF